MTMTTQDNLSRQHPATVDDSLTMIKWIKTLVYYNNLQTVICYFILLICVCHVSFVETYNKVRSMMGNYFYHLC